MSTNISSTKTTNSTLRISKESAVKARELELPESNPLRGLKFGADDFAPIQHLSWCYMGSTDVNVLRRFAALTEGDADLVFAWEGGGHTGAQIRSGKLIECDVVMTLVPKS